MRDLGTRTVRLAEILVGGLEVRSLEQDPELQDLVSSILANGLVNPLTVWATEGALRLVAGHRRYAACVVAHVVDVPVHVYECDEAEALRLAFSENFDRRDVTPMEQAARIAEILEAGAMTVDQVGATFHRSVDWVRDQAAMVRWPVNVQAAVHQGQLSAAAARELVRITDDAYRDSLLGQAIVNGVTAATCRQWVWGWQAMVPAAQVATLEATPGGVPAGPRVAVSLCMGCRHQMNPEGCVPVYVCPGCVALIMAGRLVCA